MTTTSKLRDHKHYFDNLTVKFLKYYFECV